MDLDEPSFSDVIWYLSHNEYRVTKKKRTQRKRKETFSLPSSDFSFSFFSYENETTSKENAFDVESVCGRRINDKTGRLQYKIKWSGYNNRFNCWVDAHDVQGCERLIERYLRNGR